MALFALGRTAGIASIKAAIAARTTTLADGSRLLDTASLKQWIAEQGNDILASDVVPANQVAARGVLATINVTPECDSLAGFIARSQWEGRPDWPTSLQRSQGLGFTASVSKNIIDMENTVKAIEQVYEGVYGQIEATMNAAADALGLDLKMPPTIAVFNDTRYVVCTYVTDRGEESAPSPVSTAVVCDQNDNQQLVIGAEPAGRNITAWRSYRTNVGTQGADFQLEGEYPIATKTATVTKPNSELSEICPTTLWAEPPANLRGLVNMPNGVMAGFFDNTICFCEPFVPYAWPVAYQLTVPYPVVALGVFGQTLVVLHQGGVDYISGSDSASMSVQKDVSKQACLSKTSVALVEGGVAYVSSQGVCIAAGQGVELVTKGIYLRQDWEALNPASMIGGYAEQTYFCGWSNGIANGVLMLHLPTQKLTTIDITCSAVFTDSKTDTIYLAQGTNVVKLFGGSDRRTGTWRSKVFVNPQHTPFAWLTIESAFEHPITVQWYGDGVLRYTVVLNNRLPVRLPAGRYLENEVEVITKARWNSLTMASTTQELQAV